MAFNPDDYLKSLEQAPVDAFDPDAYLKSLATPKVQEEKGFLSNVGSLIGRGSESALASAEVSPAILAGTAPEKKAGIIAKELSTPQPVTPKELKEAQTAFLDEAAAFDKAKHWYSPDALMAQAGMLGEFGKQVLTNPKGAAYLTAQSAANMAPAIVGMLLGGRTGAAVGSVVPVVGTAVGATTGAIVGGFTGQVPLETGSEFIGLVGKELSARGMEPTEANVTALLKDKKFVDKAISDARTKGITTAAVDSATTLIGGRVAAGPRRAAVEAARKELGAGADAAQIAERATQIVKETPALQKIKAGAKGVALDVAGGGASEAAGQQLAYGKVDLSDVGQEMLGELGGAAIEVPAAAYSATRDLVSRQGAVTPDGTVPPAAGIPPVAPGTPTPPPVATGPAVIADEDIETLDEEAPAAAPVAKTGQPVNVTWTPDGQTEPQTAVGTLTTWKDGSQFVRVQSGVLENGKPTFTNVPVAAAGVQVTPIEAPKAAVQPTPSETPVSDVSPPVVKMPVTTNPEEQKAAMDNLKALPVGGIMEMNGARYRKTETGWDIVKDEAAPAAAPVETAPLETAPVTAPAPLHTAVNNETKMEASVYPRDDGTFNVAQKDLESGETLPTFKNFKTQQEAVDYANTINLPKAPAKKKPAFTKAPSDPALEAEAIELADRAEAAGQKSFADGIRNTVNRTGGLNKSADLDFLRSRVKDYESQKGLAETPKQTLSLEDFIKGYDKDTKRYEQYKDTPEIKKSNEYIQLLTDKINELGFKFLDVNPTSPLEVRKLKEKISQIAGSTTSFMKKNEAIDKEYKRADPARKESINSQLAKDFAEVDALLGIAPEEDNLTPAEDWNLTVKNLSSVSNFPNVTFEELTPELQEKIVATKNKDGKLGGKNIMQFGPAIEKQLKIKANLARQAEQKAKAEEGKNAEAEFMKRVEASKEELRSWLPDFGWATEGGRIIRDPDTGEVIGRTTWEAKNQYLDSVRSSLGRSFNVIKESVQKAIAGEKLNAKQMKDVNAVIDLFDELKAEFSTELTEDEINAELDIASQEQREDYIESKVYTPETEEAPVRGGAKTEELELTGQTEAEIKADEAKAKAEAEAKAKAESQAEQRRKAEKETFTLTGSDREADKAAAAGAQGLFDKTELEADFERIKKNTVTFASGLTSINDLESGARAKRGNELSGIGIDIGELSANGLNKLAEAILGGTRVFVDSGAFSTFRSNVKNNEDKSLNFDSIIEKYDAITKAVEELNIHDDEYPSPMIVMPDVVGNQKASIDLVEKYKNYIRGEADFNSTIPIVPIQKGELTLAEVYKKITGILGTSDFTVGLPSNAEAISQNELRDFLREIKPANVHFLGAAADKTLTPLLQIVAKESPKTKVTADASQIRSKILSNVKMGMGRKEAINLALNDFSDPQWNEEFKNYGIKESDFNKVKDRIAANLKSGMDKFKAFNSAIDEFAPKKETKLVGTTTENGFKITEPIMVGLVDSGYEMLALDNEKSYKSNSGETYRSFIKDGVRVSITPQKKIGIVKDKPYKGVLTYHGNDDDMVIENIYVEPSKRNQGAATAAMKQLIELADKNNVKLYVEPYQLDKDGMTTKQLSDFYYEFGFIPQLEEDGRVLKRLPLSGFIKKEETKQEAPKAKTEAEIEAEEEAAYEALQAQAEAEVDAGPIGQAIQRIENGDFENKGQVRGFVNRLEKNGVLDDVEYAREGLSDREQSAEEVLDTLRELLDDARDNAVQERMDELESEKDNEGLLYNIESKTQTETPAFKKWFGDSKIVDKNGKPLVVYHGTKRDFNKFKSNYSDGLVFFSTNPEFAGSWPIGTGGFREGPAGTTEEANRIRDIANQLVKTMMTPYDQYDTNSPEGKKLFDKEYSAYKDELQRLTGFRDAHDFESKAGLKIMPVYLSIKNPFDATKDYAVVEDFLREKGDLNELIDKGYHKTGNWLIYENKSVIDFLKEKGYDGIWLNEITNGIQETIAPFSTTQIKSATGNSGTFDETDDILQNQIDAKAQTKTQEFKNWFGDSEVVDEDGKPLVMYHGTPLIFDNFIPNDRGLIFVTPSRKFANKWSNVQREGGSKRQVMEVYVSAKNIFDYHNRKDAIKVIAKVLEESNYKSTLSPNDLFSGDWKSLERADVVKAVKSLGYDGMYVKENENAKEDNLAVFSPNQIKSATGNRGTFDETGNIFQNQQQFVKDGIAYESEEDYRDRQIQELRVASMQVGKAVKQIASYGSNLPLQRKLNKLLEREAAIKEYLESTKPDNNSAADFMARATKELAAENISDEVEAVVRQVYEKYPGILEGLKLSVKQDKGGNGATLGRFNPYEQIVSLYKGTSGAYNAETVRHELMHSLEQMMTPQAKTAVVDEWARALEKAMKKHTDPASKAYFDAVLKFLESPSKENFNAASKRMPSYDFYQYINPSEYWAVNAEKLFASKLGTPWNRFVIAVKRVIEALKNVLGFDNNYQVHKVFNSLLKTTPERMSKQMLIDYVTRGKVKLDFLQNVEEDRNLVDDIGVPAVPSHTTRTAKEFLLGGWKKTQETAIDIANEPKSNVTTALSKAGDLVTLGRIRNVWYGAGLDAADFAKYGGQIRDANGRLLPSIALKNAIKAAYISTRVILDGGLEMNARHGIFMAVKKSLSMANVFKLQAKLRKEMGVELADRVINGYFIAKRSRSIQNNYFDVSAQVRILEEDLLTVEDPDAAAELSSELTSLQAELKNIRMAYEKIPAFLCKIDESEPTITTDDGKEVPNVLYDDDGLPLLNDEAMDGLINQDVRHPELKEMMTNWTAVNHNMLDMMAFSGRISQKEADKLKAIKDYSPWARLVDERQGLYDARSISANTSGIKHFKAGRTELDVDNVIESMTHNIQSMVKSSVRTYAYNRIAIEYGTRKPSTIDRTTGLEKPGKLKVYPQEGRFEEGVRIPIFANGRRIIIQIEDSNIAEAMLGLAMGPIDFPMQNVLSAAANLTRRTITFSLYFQAKQVFYDAPTAAWVSGVRNPFKLWAGCFSAFARSVVNPDNATAEVLKSAGFGGFQSHHRSAKGELELELGIMNRSLLSRFLKGIDHFGDASDLSQRIPIYEQTIAETGDPMLAILKASDVMDFQKSGNGRAAQALKVTVPFMQAYATQLDALAQAAIGGNLKGMSRKEAKTQFIKTGSLLAGTCLLYAFMAGGDDDYWELDDNTRLRNFYLPGSKKFFGNHVLIPMHSTASYFFKAIPEMLYSTITSQGTKNEIDMKRLRTVLAESAYDSLLGPTPIPSGVRPFVEIAFNHDFFTGGNVTPRSLEKLDAARQYNASTSEMGKMISSLTGTDKHRLLNPIEADKLMRGILGSVGALSMYYSNVIFGEDRVAPQLKDNPLLGGIIGADVQRKNEELLYTLAEITSKADATFNDLHKKGFHEEAREYFKENKDLIKANGYVKASTQSLDDINAEIKRIGGSPNDKTYNTPEKRLARINELKEIKNKALKDVIRFRLKAGL